jgi:hypothetical protein
MQRQFNVGRGAASIKQIGAGVPLSELIRRAGVSASRSFFNAGRRGPLLPIGGWPTERKRKAGNLLRVTHRVKSGCKRKRRQ